MPNDVLGRIWNLADRDQKGSLGLTEFIIAMHLLASYKNGSMRALPQILPPGLYDAAVRRGIARQVTGSRPTSEGVVASALPRQFSGSGYQGQPSSTSRQLHASFRPATPSGDQWAVSPQDKVQFDQIYATLDTQNRGFITGEQAVGFFSNSRLPEEALAQIWDLADINSEGQLTRDEFAVAMYLIRQQRSKRDGRDGLPQSLPSNLIPPSMRRQPIGPQHPTAPVFDNAANITAPQSASEDLFGLDAFSTPPPPQPRTANDTQITSTPPRDTSSPQTPSQSQVFQQQTSHFKPFVPSSSFGQTMMTPQGTGTPSTVSPVAQSRSLPQQQWQPAVLDDLLGDNDPEVSKRLTKETSELANLSNQVSTLTGQMEDTKNKRGSVEQSLSQAQSQKRDFENRLSQLRSAYEQEVREVEALEERLRNSRNETQKLRQDMAMVHGTHQKLQNQHLQIGEALNQDQTENANLKEKIRQTNAEISELKPQLEKLRSDGRQQKGLVAIIKKQLAINQIDLEKIRSELEAAAKEKQIAVQELEQSKRDLEASSQALAQARSLPPAVASPAPSSASLNPFFRRTSNATEKGSGSPFASPTSTVPIASQNVSSPNHKAFDNFFGPSLVSSSQANVSAPSTSLGAHTQDSSPNIPEQPIASNQSPKSSEGPDFPTPSGSPPPLNSSDSPHRVAEPPAPPQSRQMTSSFLPLRTNLQRSGSGSSSIRANPPVSRMSSYDTSTERQASATETLIPESPIQHFQQMAAKAPQAEPSQLTPPSPLKISNDGMRPHEATVSSDLSETSRLPRANDVPGAFPGDETPVGEPELSFHESTLGPYSSSKLDPRLDSLPRSSSIGSTSQPSSLKGEARQVTKDPFAMIDSGTRSPELAKDDFDSAFVGFGAKGKAAEHTDGIMPSSEARAPKPRGEFPPIQELGADDESDSEEERGFDDNFTAHSTNRTTEPGPNEALQNPIVSDAPTRPPFNTVESNASQLPTPGAQSSPPTYDQTVGVSPEGPDHRKGSNQFPAEYGGLLPSREDPTLPPTSTPEPKVVTNVGSHASFDRKLNFLGEDISENASAHTNIGSTFYDHSPMSPGASTSVHYAYNHTESPPPAQNPQPKTATYQPVPAKALLHDDFDDEFGDLSEAKEASEKGDEDLSSSRRADFDEFNPVFDSPAASRHTAESSTTFPPSDSFADFESSISGPSLPQQQQKGGTGTTETPSEDWDAIFAGLYTPQNNGVQGHSRASEFPEPAQQQPQQSTQSQQQQQQLPPAEKPALKRVTEDTEADDPILKRLTGMGYPREESLQALERFDYNLDKVCALLPCSWQWVAADGLLCRLLTTSHLIKGRDHSDKNRHCPPRVLTGQPS